MRNLICAALISMLALPVIAQHHHAMQLTDKGMVMNANGNRLPDDCQRVSEEYQFTIYAGVEYSEPFVDKTFGYSDYELRVKPCAKVTVTFVNRDAVRHQWMLHGLPRYLYDQGMFHLEAAGGEQVEGSFIMPSDHKTYLLHCDIAQHMEKGMKAQLVVGRGSGDLWSVPGVSGDLMYAESVSNRFAVFLLISSITTIAVIIAIKR